jgi:DNA-binding response OmpR family regulator
VAINELTVLICEADAIARSVVAREAEAAGYTVVGETDVLPHGIELARLVGPNLVVVGDDLPQAEGLIALREFKAELPTCEVLLLTRDESAWADATEAGAFGVIAKARLSELSGAYGRVRDWLTTADERPRGERRTGKDRRHHQDWNKVTQERRTGQDRRGSEDEP